MTAGATWLMPSRGVRARLIQLSEEGQQRVQVTLDSWGDVSCEGLVLANVRQAPVQGARPAFGGSNPWRGAATSQATPDHL